MSTSAQVMVLRATRSERPAMAERADETSPRRAAASPWANSDCSEAERGRVTVWRVGAERGAVLLVVGGLRRSPMGSTGWARATVVATRMAQPARSTFRVRAFK